MHSISLIEPSWWQNLLQRWMNLQGRYDRISNLAPIFADIFVVIYPVFLIWLYIYGIIRKKSVLKQWALFVFFATLFAVLINIWIQTFFIKERPIVVFNHISAEETLLHDILPTSSFPSDHAVVSMCFAIAVLLWWAYVRNKFLKVSWILLILISFLMTACRMLTLVHWPTDIIVWLLLWGVVPCILIIRPIRYCVLRFIINPVISFEQWIMKKVFKYEQ